MIKLIIVSKTEHNLITIADEIKKIKVPDRNKRHWTIPKRIRC